MNMQKAKKLPSGNWRIQVFLGRDENGKKIIKSITANSKRDCEYKAAMFISNREAALNKTESLTVKQGIRYYIDTKEGTLSPSTIKGYMTHYRRHYTFIEDIKLADLNQSIVQSWISSLAKTLSPKSVSNAYGLFVAMLNYLEVKICLSNVKLPQKIQNDITVPTNAEVKKILDYFKGNNKDMYIACLLAAEGTLRRGEICALTAADVDKSNNTISVHRSKVMDKNNSWIIKDVPKNDSSNRVIQLPAEVIALLPKSGYIVKTSPSHITRIYANTIKKLGLPHSRFHDLRHYAASIMHAIGIPDVYIMKRGGWSNDKTLKAIYRNELSDFDKQYTEMTNNYFSSIF